MRYTRCRELFGDDFKKLRQARILLLGAGGVGSFCLDCLYRSGVTDITIVDFDTYDETNQNRQIGAEAIGERKVDRLAKLYPGITPLPERIDEAWVERFDFDPYDLVLDAIDDIRAKIALAQKVWPKLISATGSAKKIDPTRIQTAPMHKTHGDPFARKIRNELKKRRFKGRYTAVFSPEEPRCTTKGSFVAVTGAFGLTLCAEAIKRLIDSERN